MLPMCAPPGILFVFLCFFFCVEGGGGGESIIYCRNLNLHSPQSDSLEQASNKYFLYLSQSRLS